MYDVCHYVMMAYSEQNNAHVSAVAETIIPPQKN